MKKILVTGSSGGIGSALVPFLCEKNYEVIGIDLVSSNYHINNLRNFTFVEGSIHDCEVLLKPYEDEIDIVIHLAATSSLPECESDPLSAFQNNLMGTVKLANYFTAHKITRFINASTSAVYEGITEIPFSENMPCKPHLVYPQTKLMSENYLESLGTTRNFPATSLRFFNVIGPFQSYTRQSPPLLNYLVKEYLGNRSPVLHSDGNQKRDYISVYDICIAIESAFTMQHSGHQIFNVCSGTALSVKEINAFVKSYVETELEPSYRESELLWFGYKSLYEGEYPLKLAIVSDETNKISLGTADKFRKATGWKIQNPIDKVIQQICETAISHQSGRI